MNYKAIGDYRVYEDGTVVSVKGRRGEHTLKQFIDRNGYRKLQLRFGKYGNSYTKCYTVHRLVATLFLENPNNYTDIDHIDGDKLNNHYSNLRWCTHKENCNNPNTVKNLRNFNNYVRHVHCVKKLKSGIIKEYNYTYGICI